MANDFARYSGAPQDAIAGLIRREAEDNRWVSTQCDGMPFQTASDALRYLKAGNATLTLRSAKTGVRYTYRVRLADPPEQSGLWADETSVQRWFVSLLAGTENESDYVYLGVLEERSGRVAFRLTKKSRMTRESLPVVAFSWAVTQLAKGALPASLEIWHTGRCGRCGRLLTVPESVALGIGPECAERMGL